MRLRPARNAADGGISFSDCRAEPELGVLRTKICNLGGTLPLVGSRSSARRAWPRAGAAGASPPIRVTIVAAEPAARDAAQRLSLCVSASGPPFPVALLCNEHRKRASGVRRPL